MESPRMDADHRQASRLDLMAEKDHEVLAPPAPATDRQPFPLRGGAPFAPQISLADLTAAHPSRFDRRRRRPVSQSNGSGANL